VLNQSELSKQAWAAEVSKMINAQKAPGASEDVAAMVDDLTRVTGAK
jgi:hypothetical protein